MATSRRLRDIGMLGSVLILGLVTDDWVAGVGLAMLFVGWRFLLREPGPPIIAAAFSSQWLQVMVGILYLALTGRRIMEMQTSDYRPMVLIGLGCVAVLFAGFYLAAGFRRSRVFNDPTQRPLPWTTNQICVVYIGTVALGGILQELAWSTSGLTQAILVFSRIRYVFLFLLVTRLVRPRLQWPWIAAILLAELALGFTGFFADFREPLVIVGIAILGGMDRRNATTWVIIAAIGVLGITSAVVWTAIKPVIREDYVASASRSERLTVGLTATGSVFASDAPPWKYQSDNLVSRLWSVYYPALALKRVPSVLPHENGKILWAAVNNVLMPRLFFPSKPTLPSSSDQVRKYAGVWVAGRETNTSFAFGYVAESYVDFGLPLMLLPVFVFGLMLGFTHRWLNSNIRSDELRKGVTIVVFWATMSSYETSWVMIIGPALTLLAVLGGGAIVLERTITTTMRKNSAAERSSGLKARPGPAYGRGDPARATSLSQSRQDTRAGTATNRAIR